MVLGAEVQPEIPRKWSKAVPEGNGLVPQQDEFGLEQPTLAEFYRMIEEGFDRSDRKLDELIEKTREGNRRLAGLLHGSQQPRLAKEADVKSDTKTHKRTEDVAADRVTSGDSSSAQVDPVPMCLASFGDDSTEPLAFPRRDDALVDKSAATPKSCLSLVKMRTLTATGGLLPAGTAFSAIRTNFQQPSLWFCTTKKNNLRTPVQYATTYSSFWKLKVLQTKTRQNMVFNSGGSADRLCACPFLAGWCALLRGEVFIWAPDGTRGWSIFWQKDDLEYHFPREIQTIRYTEGIAVNRCLSATKLL